MNKKRYKCVHYEVQKAQHGHKDVFPVTLSQTGHLPEDRSGSFARVIEKSFKAKNVFVSVWCVLECSGNLFTLSTLFGKVNKQFYLIDYELHVSDTMPFSLPFLSFLLKFCYQTDYKKEYSSEVWTMDVQLLRINFSFEKKNPCKFQHYSELPWAFWVNWLCLLDDNTKN